MVAAGAGRRVAGQAMPLARLPLGRRLRPLPALALIAATLVAMGCGGEPAAVPRRPPVFFIGLDGADWQFLDPLIADGSMPNLAELVATGRRGVLRTESPPLSPLLWTTMMTGQDPLRHGILDFTRFHPITRAREPITSAERRVPAIWNMASAAGRRVATYGMWATYPAEAVDGVVVSERLFSFQRRETAPAGIVFPADQEAAARRALAESAAAVDEEELRRYLPWLTAEEYARHADPDDPFAHPVSALRRILIETAVYHRLATEGIVRLRPDLAVIYIQGTDAIGHVFAPYAPPRQEWIAADDFARYSTVPARYFGEVDRLLGEYRRLAADQGAQLFLASDHGFLWGDGRPRELSSQAQATAGKWHRDEGIYLLWGPDLPAGAGEPGEIARVCATLLALLGMPPGIGVAGPPLAGVPGGTAESVDYGRDFHAAPAPGAGAVESGEELAKLRALGYVGSAEPPSAPAASPAAHLAPGEASTIADSVDSILDSTRTAGSFNNEGLIREARGDASGAAAAFSRALELDPRHAGAAWNLSRVLFSGRQLERADAFLLRAIGDGLPGGEEQVVARISAHRREQRGAAADALLDAAVALLPDAADLRLLHGRQRMTARDCRGAEADFSAATNARPADAVAFASLGLARLCRNDARGARAALARSLALDPHQPEVAAALAALAQ